MLGGIARQQKSAETRTRWRAAGSLRKPSATAHAAVEMCTNVRMFPVLVGDANDALVLSSPIILYDWPEIAPESAGALFDATVKRLGMNEGFHCDEEAPTFRRPGRGNQLPLL